MFGNSPRWGFVFVLWAGGCGPNVHTEEDAGAGSASSGDDDAGDGVTPAGADGDADHTASSGGEQPEPIPGGESTGVPPDGDDGDESDCFHAVRCLIIVGGGVTVFRADTGDVCGGLVLDRPVSATSIAWGGLRVLLCEEDELGRGRLTEADLDFGTVESLDIECEAVADFDPGVALMPSASPDEVLLYTSGFALLDGDPADAVTWHPHARTIAASTERFYSAPREHGVVTVTEIVDPMGTSDLDLEGFDGPIHGMAIVDSRLFVLAGHAGDRLVEFDAATGAFLREVDLPPDLRGTGLACTPPWY